MCIKWSVRSSKGRSGLGVQTQGPAQAAVAAVIPV